MGSSSSTQKQKTDMTTNQYQHMERFTGDMLPVYKDALGRSQGLADNLSNYVGQVSKQGSAGDFKDYRTAWNQAQGIDNSQINKMNTMSWNPNDDKDWVAANDAIDQNARLGWGQSFDQVNQNIIGSGMANGSGHQTAAYRQAANLNSQLAADRANRWQQQYNQNKQQQLAANGQLQDFYTKLSNIGLDYAKLTQQDLATMLDAYATQNDALRTLGTYVQMGSNPTTTSTSHTQGETTTKTSSGGGFGDILGDVLNLGAAGFASGLWGNSVRK